MLFVKASYSLDLFLVCLELFDNYCRSSSFVTVDFVDTDNRFGHGGG